MSNEWSSALYLDGAIPDATSYGDTYSFKTLPLSGDRALVVWEWEQTTNIPLPNPDGTVSYKARVVSAGDPPVGGNITIVSNLDAVITELFGTPTPGDGQPNPDGWSNDFNYAFGLTAVSDTRVLFTVTGGARRFDGTYHRRSFAAFVLLGVAGDVVTVLDTKYLAQDSDVTGMKYDEYTESVTIGPTKTATFVAESTDIVSTASYYVVDTAGDTLTVGSPQPTPFGYPNCGAWSDGSTVGVVLNSDSENNAVPFTISGDTLTFTPCNIAWTTAAEHPDWQWFNEGMIAGGPGPRQFTTSTNDTPDVNGADYITTTTFETDGSTVSIVAQSLSYNEDAGFGYPSAWLPNSVTRDGRVLGLYSNGDSYWDSQPTGGHGHQHHGSPVLLIDMMNKATYDDVTEAPMPTDRGWELFATDPGYSERCVQATETGAFVICASYTNGDAGNIAALVGWVSLRVPPLAPALDAELGLVDQRFM